MFDEPRLRELPSGISRIVIAQASTAGAALGIEGGLMLGWIATRLGLKAASLAGKLRLVRPNDQSRLRLQLRAEPAPQSAPGALRGLEIEASVGDLTVRGSIVCETDDAEKALWRREVAHGGERQRIEQRVLLRANEPSRLLERTLRRPRYDESLAESATWADELRDEEVACA
jgi:hypothetical protein